MDAHQRWDAYRRVSTAAQAAGISLAGFLVPNPDRLRYRLDAGSAGWLVPYALDAALGKRLSAALLELAVLYVTRNRLRLGEEAYDSLLLNADPVPAQLGPLADAAPAEIQSPAFRHALERSGRILPGLDAGVLLAWWGAGTLGRELLKALTDLQLRAVDEMAASETGEATPVIVQLVLFQNQPAAMAVTEGFDWSEPVRAELGRALRLGLHLTHHLVRSRVIELRPQALGVQSLPGMIWSALMSPRAAFAGAPDLLAGCRYYPVALGALGERRTDLVELLDERGATSALHSLRGWLARDADLARAAQTGLAMADLLRRALALRSAGPLPAELSGFVDGLLFGHEAAGGLADKKWRKSSVRLLEGQASGTDLAGPLGELAAAIKRYNPRHPCRGLYDESQVERRVVASLLAQAGDVLADRAAQIAMARLSHRTGQESDRSLPAQYEAGRLYWIGTADRPLLQARARTREVSHYFIDVKDFTRQTAVLKEAGMAEYLRREFFEPILAVAREHHRGLTVLDDRGGVHLNNMPGDAVSMSGDVIALVRIARAIRRHLDAYAARLAVRGGDPLVAGSFIAYGAAPEVVTFADPAFGELKVAIASGINESARGTARNAQLGADLDAWLAGQRAKTGRADLRPAFRTFTGPAQGVPLLADVEREVVAALGAGDRATALARLGESCAGWVDELLSAGPEAQQAARLRAAELYNAGDALSGEALAAYRAALGVQRQFLETTLAVDDLPPALRDGFAFRHYMVRLVVGWAPGQARPEEVFRFAGRVAFKGFEGERPVEVWELVVSQDPAGRLLYDHLRKNHLSPQGPPA